MAMRLLTAEKVLDELADKPDDPFALAGCELATLQIRLICELIMLGAQMAHLEDAGADLSETKWRPVNAYAQLKDLSEHPLPMPVKVELHKNGMGQHNIDPISRPISFQSISRVYGLCGDLLHAPTIKRVAAGKMSEFDVALLRSWVGDLKNLASSHVLMLPERKIIFLALWTGKIENEPELFRLDAAGQSTFVMENYPVCDLLQ
ncbi:hypothetical protein [Erythrobacter litoralis]|nr:hypothetical protein [Erythrobacter litoralis]